MGKTKSLQAIKELLDNDTATKINAFLEASSIEDIKLSAKNLVFLLGEVNEDNLQELTPQVEAKLVESFHKNLTLLIQKTWVEQFDDSLKAYLLSRLDIYCNDYEKITKSESFSRFTTIIDDAVYLMFGAMTKASDFCEYAIRVDPEFGVFWAYIDSLKDATSWSEEKYHLALVLGMFFLANY